MTDKTGKTDKTAKKVEPQEIDEAKLDHVSAGAVARTTATSAAPSLIPPIPR